MNILKIQIHVAQNVDKFWISWKNSCPAPVGAIPSHFSYGPKQKTLKITKKQDFPWWALFTRAPSEATEVEPAWHSHEEQPNYVLVLQGVGLRLAVYLSMQRLPKKRMLKLMTHDPKLGE